MRKLSMAIVSCLIACAAGAAPVPMPGEVWTISTDRESESHGNRSNSGQSTTSDRDTYVERVIAVRPEGIVLEYDFSPDTSADERASDWHLPARVLKPPHGPLRLLNEAALEARVDPWLRASGMTRAACGKLIFTWNAFRIHCDPETVLSWLETLQVPQHLEVGMPVTDPEARTPAALRQAAPRKYVATLAIDGGKIRQQRAQGEVGAGEILKKPLTLQAALARHADEALTGTITIAYEVDAAGRVGRRTRVRLVQTAWPDGRMDTETVTDTLTRTLSRPAH